MIIELPKTFIYTEKDSHGIAYVENGKLYIYGSIYFEKLMYSLAYEINGKDYCAYCNNPINDNNRTIDHKFPRVFGGVSIPNNLVPCCRRCNEQKQNMTYNQFIHWEKLEDARAQKLYFTKVFSRNQEITKAGKIILPKSWLVKYDATELLDEFDESTVNESSKFTKKIESYYKRHKHYQRPVIISSNAKILQGKHVLIHAKRNNIKEVDAIILDNVVKFSSMMT